MEYPLTESFEQLSQVQLHMEFYTPRIFKKHE